MKMNTKCSSINALALRVNQNTGKDKKYCFKYAKCVSKKFHKLGGLK